MSRPVVWPPRITRHASGQARVVICGISYYLGPFDSEESRRRYAELLTRHAEGKLREKKAQEKQGKPRVLTLTEQWQSKESQRLNAKEVYHYRRIAEKVNRFAGEIYLVDFGVSNLDGFRRSLIAENAWSRNYINAQLRRLRSIWRWGEVQGFCPRGSWEHLRTLQSLPSHDRRVRNTPAVQPATWKTLVAVCRRARAEVRAMLLLQWFTGMRPSEVCRMRRCDLVEEGSVWVYIPETHKNTWRGQERRVMLGHVCQKILSPFLSIDPSLPLFQPAAVHRRKRLHYTSETYSRAVARYAESAGVQLHPYQLRHSCKQRVTRALGLDAARAVLGQKSILTTDRYAAGVDDDTARRAAENLS